MRARKRNRFWGIGLDKRQARRFRRRVARSQRECANEHQHPRAREGSR